MMNVLDPTLWPIAAIDLRPCPLELASPGLMLDLAI